MSSNYHDGVLDDESTDELPVLTEALMAEFERSLPLAPLDETHSPRRAVDGSGPDQGFSSLQQDLRSQAARINALEAKIAGLEPSDSDLLSERDARIAALEKELVAQEQERAKDRQRIEQPLLDELQDREKEIAHLNNSLEENRARVKELQAKLAHATATSTQLEDERAKREQVIERLHRELAEASEHPEEAASGNGGNLEARLASAQQEAAALSGYITNRRQEWQELEAKLAAREARIAELQVELEQRTSRQTDAERRARDDAKLARSLRSELAKAARELRERECELAEIKGSMANAKQELAKAQAKVDEAVLQAESELEAEPRQAVVRLEEQVEVLGKEKAELQQALARANEELSELRTQSTYLQGLLVEKEQTMQDHASRTSAVENDLESAFERARLNLEAVPVAIESVNEHQVTDAQLTEKDPPQLVCLTEEQPVHYCLNKPLMTVGRGPDSDIHILTHYVSREHAQLIVDAERVVIEDLASKNGVYVNAVRIDRHQLRDGDLLTVGETQFRYVAASPTSH